MDDPVVDAQPEVSHETSRPERVVAKPKADSRLEALHCQYKPLKEAFEQAEQALKELKAAITAELEAEYQGDDRPSHSYVIPESSYGPQLNVYYKSSEYLPVESIRKNFPAIWDAFKQKTAVHAEVREKQQSQPRGRRK